jgi:hypothetical protein
MLTLHLYDNKEVMHSLCIAIVKKKYMETMFWALELYDSGLIDPPSLITMWILHFGLGPRCFSVLADILVIDSLDRDEFIKKIYSWCHMDKDSSVFHLLLKGLNSSIALSPEYKTLEKAMEGYLMKGATVEAWLTATKLDTEVQWFILNKIAKAKKRVSQLDVLRGLENDTLSIAAAFILVSISDESFKEAMLPYVVKSVLPKEITETINDWDAEPSIRKRRIYKIKPEALNLCERGTRLFTDSSLPELQDNFTDSLKASSCWQSILEDYLENDEWKSDIYKEMFYNTYFPWTTDDIPDEWSLKDKEQSHGPGLGKTKQNAIIHYVTYMLNQSRFIPPFTIKTYPETLWG